MASATSQYLGLENFELVRKLGSGQFSVVHHARCKSNGKEVALKKMEFFEMSSAKARAECIREIELLKQLDHPNIIKYLSSFVENNALYIVLELAAAGDLAGFISQYKNKHKLIPERIIWKFFTQLTSALEHMHEKRILHRDLKPANIFITAEGILKLGDLDLGRFFSARTTTAHTLLGTPYYMSPERVFEHGYDFKSDIWSLGCILYELAALNSPFYGDNMNMYSLCKKIERCSYPPIPSDNYSDELSDVVKQCIKRNPKSRPDITTVRKQAEKVNKRFNPQDDTEDTVEEIK